MITISTKNWSIENVDGVIFDKDGTIIDSHLYWGGIIQKRSKALIEFYKMDQSFYPILCQTMGFSLKSKKLLPEGPIALVSRDEVIRIVHKFLSSNGVLTTISEIGDIFAKEHTNFIKVMYDYISLLEGVEDFLLKLQKKKVKCAIVTSDGVKNTIEILKFLRLDSIFKVIIGKESTTESKETGIPAMEALKKLGVQKEKAVCIGDAPMDLIMGKKSGLKTSIGIASGQIGVDQLKKYSPYIISTMKELEIS